MPEIKPTVDHVGLMEPPKLITIDYASKPTELMILHYLLLTPLLVVDSSVVSHKDVTEDKSEPHGLGSKTLESSPEETSQIPRPVTHIPCQNVPTTSTQLNTQIAPQLNKSTQPVTPNAQETVLIIALTKYMLHHHIL